MNVVFIRRWVLGICVAAGVIIIIGLSRSKVEYDTYAEEKTSNFHWIDVENLTEYRECRNSVQGPDIIVDERGYVCNRTDLSAGGCCHSDGKTSVRYKCEGCQTNNNCCCVYEHCVSCCLKPDKKSLLYEILNLHTGVPSVISKSVGDQFELCLVKCRTFSGSVWHENLYRDKRFKYCFGKSAPGFVFT